MKTISVVIPNWNGLKHLRVCLNSLRSQICHGFEVIVADNASSDGSRALLACDYPEVRTVALNHNAGFAGACNAGIRVSKGAIVTLLNNDTEVHPSWLRELEAAFERHPDAGIIASRMLVFDQRDTFHTAGDLYRVNGVPANRGVWELDTGQYNEGYVFSACGGAAAYRREMLEQIGLLDEDFFFSCEDIDLAWRAQLQGWRAVYAPEAIVYHRMAATGGGSTASFHDGRNVIYLLIKNVPSFIWRQHWRAIITAQIRLAWKALCNWRGMEARARLWGQVVGLLAIPRLLRKRRVVQAARTVSDEYIASMLTQ
jgi:GT2 family glycosyltransferase